MRCFALTVLSTLLVLTASSQTTKPKPQAPASVKSSSAGKKTSAHAKKPSAVAAKKPSAGPTANESSEWEKASALTDPAERVAAFKKFIKSFPRSEHVSEAAGLVANAEAGLGNDKLAAADVDGAVVLYKAAVTDAPVPVPAGTFANFLAKIPANLYFRGAREPALEIAQALEQKAGGDVTQILAIASFYLNIENGSEAKRLAMAAIAADPESSDAYQTLGLAHRLDFQLEDSAAAYARALELKPDSMTARRGLAEMDRSLGKPEQAITLYREILAADAANLPANTGLILALFDAGKQSEAETELATSLESNPGNVILLAGSAYWYAAHNDGAKAVSFAQKAIDADPRFIWSHIAMARGLLAQKNPVAAERVLLKAKRYGNFPTLEYEIASARLAAGLYRDAADELVKSFSIKDGEIYVRLGGRVERKLDNFTELVGFERRASIFAPTAADDPGSAVQLASLLKLRQELEAPQPDQAAALSAVDEFVRGDDPMKVHRQLYAAATLLEKNVAVPQALELAQAAPKFLDAGLKVPEVVTPVIAGELYDSRRIALARGEYLNTPEVPPNILSAIMRGRIEDLTAWALYIQNDPDGALIHSRRALSVLPADSAWWRTANWHYGNALALAGKDAEALEAYIKTYTTSAPDPIKYDAVVAMYKRVKGSTDGLEARIGQRPGSTPVPEVLAAATPQPEPTAAGTMPAPVVKLPRDLPIAVDAPPVAEIPRSPAPTPEPAPAVIETTPQTTPAAEPISVPSAEPTPEQTAKQSEPEPALPEPKPDEASTPATPEPGSEAMSTPATPEPTAAATHVSVPAPTVEVVNRLPAEPLVSQMTATPIPDGKKGLFEPVIITIPPPGSGKPAGSAVPSPEAVPSPSPAAGEVEPKPAGKKGELTIPAETKRAADRKDVPAPDVEPCTLTSSEESITIRVGGGEPLMIGRADESEDIDGLTAVSTSPDDIAVRRENIEGIKGRAIFVVRSTGTRPGIYQVQFEMPCGKKEVVVKIK